VRCWAFLGKGSSKTTQGAPKKKERKKRRTYLPTFFLRFFEIFPDLKSMSKTYSKQIDKKFDVDVSFSSIFFVLSRFRVFAVLLSDVQCEFKSTKKNVYKEIVSKSFY
jgi:hypothetical protein